MALARIVQLDGSKSSNGDHGVFNCIQRCSFLSKHVVCLPLQLALLRGHGLQFAIGKRSLSTYKTPWCKAHKFL